MKKQKKFSRGRAPNKSQRNSALTPATMPKGRIVAGIHAVKEALKVRGHDVKELWLRDKFQDSQTLQALEQLAQTHKIKISTKPVGSLDKILASHQGAVAFVGSEPTFDLNAVDSLKYSSILLLDGVEDPHNLGAVLRTAWLIGANAVLIPEVRATALTPAVSKVAQGACEHIPLIRDNLQSILEFLKTKGYWVLGLSHEAKQGLYDAPIPEKVVWALGSEASGLRKPLERLCDSLVSIPQIEPSASYNVSVAAALALGETFRQRTAITE